MCYIYYCVKIICMYHLSKLVAIYSCFEHNLCKCVLVSCVTLGTLVLKQLQISHCLRMTTWQDFKMLQCAVLEHETNCNVQIMACDRGSIAVDSYAIKLQQLLFYTYLPHNPPHATVVYIHACLDPCMYIPFEMTREYNERMEPY